MKLAAAVFVVAVTACGSSSTTATASPSPSLTVPTPSKLATPPASRACPTAATVNAALGVTLPAPVGVAGAGGTTLPPGAKATACEYHAASYNVIIILITGITPSIIGQFSSKFPVPYTNVPGVGDQARAFNAPLNGGKDNEGVVATKGSTLVAITATATPATLAQLETLVKQLL